MANAKAKRTRRPAPPDNFTPVTRDDVSDLAAMPRMLSLFMTETRMSFQGLTYSLDEIKKSLERLTRHVEHLDGRVDRLEQSQRQMNERIERLEGEAKKGQGQ